MQMRAKNIIFFGEQPFSIWDDEKQALLKSMKVPLRA